MDLVNKLIILRYPIIKLRVITLKVIFLIGFTNFSVQPLRISSVSGLFLSIIGSIYLLFLIIRKIINPGMPAGWTSILAAIIFFGGIQLLSIGLLGEYIGRVFNNK